MNEWTVIKMMLDQMTDMDLVFWAERAADWEGSGRRGKALLGAQLSRAVAREIGLRR